MESETAFIRTDGSVELHTVAEVGLHLSLVIYPSHAESEDTVRLDHALHYLGLLKLRVLVIHLFNRLQHLLYGLQVLCLAGVLCRQLRHDSLYFHNICVL